MKRILRWPLLVAFALLVISCGKQETAAERQAEIDRQVQQRLDAEHQAAEKDKLTQQQANLDAREKALAAKESEAAAATRTESTEAAAETPRADAPNESETDTYTTFYRKLDPYGDWMETGNYGYVFQPRQAAQSHDWRPYTNGHWVYTDAGWTWISDEPFGWATYHYGRWTRLRSVGWVWVPGEQWAPAWVSWRKGNDYVGWAPLPPAAHFNRDTGIRNWADNRYDIGPEQYAFVPANEFGGAQSSRVVVPSEHNVTIINQTTNVTNITYRNTTVVDRGPSYDDLRARSRNPIRRLRLERTQNLNEDRPVIRGEVVAMPAPEFRPAAHAARPQRVQRKIAQATEEHGWQGIRDDAAAQQARRKMQSEATPPPNLPEQKVVRPTPAASAPATPRVVPNATPAPSATAKPMPSPKPSPTAGLTPIAKPSPATKPSPPAKPSPTARPSPIMKSSPTTKPLPPPTPPSTKPAVRPSLNPEQEKRQERLKTLRAEKREERQAAQANPSPSPRATATQTPPPGKAKRAGRPRPNQP